jgi:hypothetical protein
MTDWNKIKFRASSWGKLMTEPRSKKEGELSKTCQTELIKIYNWVKYGRKKQVVIRQMIKGIICEPESITLYSRVEKKLFLKNNIQLENEWATGHPDIFDGETIHTATEIDDIKTSWEMDTFTPKAIEDTDAGYDYQLNCYFDLVPTAKSGNIVYCLVDAPPELIQDELKRLQFDMNIIWDEDPKYLEAAAEIIKNMTFGDIDMEERVIKIPVARDEVKINQMKAKVPALRDWLAWFEKLRMNGRKIISTPAPAIDLASIVLQKIKK